TFRYQDSVLVPFDPPTPQSPRPKSKASVTSSGLSDLVDRAAWLSAPSAVGPFALTDLPLPPVPLPKQVAFELVRMLVVPVTRDWSVSTLSALPTTRRSTLALKAEAAETRHMKRTRASAQAAAGRDLTSVGIEAALSSRVVLAGRGQVSWLPGWSA